MKKIVDVVAVVKKEKDDKSYEYKPARSIRDGKVEKWWKDLVRRNGKDQNPHNINKTIINRTLSGRTDMGFSLPSVEDTLKAFNFRGFEFGNWLSQADRYDVFRTFQFCLADMADWLGTSNIGFDNQIGVAFGARGSRGARAHYEALENVINMTKLKGAGSLLHEYSHAIDYCIGAYVDQNGYYSSISGGHTLTQEKDNVGCQFRAMMNKILNYVRSTESYDRMTHALRPMLSYWGNSTELFARLTETYYGYFYNKSNNHYLVKENSYYEEMNKEDGRYLTKAEIAVIKPELDKFWKEVASLLNNKCTLKATPFPKIETSNQHSATEIYKIVEETLFVVAKKKIKTNFKNRYNLKTRISKGKGTDYTVISDLPTKEIIFNDRERLEFSNVLSEALNKAGIKHTKTENGGNDGRRFYYRIDIENVFRSKAEPNVRLSFSFVDAEPKEEKKGKGVKKEPKADSSKKKVEKRPDKLSFDFGKFVLKGKLLPNEQKKIALQYAWEKENYRVASDMFKLVYEKLENSLEDGYARVFDKHNNLVYAGKDSQKAYGVFPDFEAAVAIKPKKDVKLDIQKLSKSIEEIKAIVKENKAKLKKFPKRPVMSTMPKGYEDAYYKSQWIDTATFVIDSVKFNYETVSAMLYVNKMWNLNTLLIESPYRGCMMQNEDGSKKAFFMPVTIYGDDGELNSLSDKQKKMLKERGYFIGL